MKTVRDPGSAAVKQRIEAIEQVKGLAILLVVAAHLVKYQTLPSAGWYELFKFKVYLFHMPLFMFASGYVFFHGGAHLLPLKRMPGYGRQRANRLLVPFVALGLASLCGKLLLSPRLHVDEAPASLAQALLSAVTHTESSPVLTIWYLFVLFIYCVATPVLYRIAGCRLAPLVVLAAFLYPLAPPDILFADRVTRFYIFFLAGGVAQSFRAMERLPGAAPSGVLGASFVLLLMLPLDRETGMLACGMIAAVAVPAVLQWTPLCIRRVLHFCGEHSMAIYLFNVIAIGLAKAAFLQVFNYRPGLFIPLLIVTFCAGLGFPLLIKWLSSLSPRTAVIHRYIS